MLLGFFCLFFPLHSPYSEGGVVFRSDLCVGYKANIVYSLKNQKIRTND